MTLLLQQRRSADSARALSRKHQALMDCTTLQVLHLEHTHATCNAMAQLLCCTLLCTSSAVSRFISSSKSFCNLYQHITDGLLDGAEYVQPQSLHTQAVLCGCVSHFSRVILFFLSVLLTEVLMPRTVCNHIAAHKN